MYMPNKLVEAIRVKDVLTVDYYRRRYISEQGLKYWNDLYHNIYKYLSDSSKVNSNSAEEYIVGSESGIQPHHNED